MSDFNRVILLGRIGNVPEVKTSAQGKAYLKLSVATHSFKADGAKTTHWHRVMVFGTQADICATYLKKGSPVFVEGMLEVRTYTDKEDRKVTSVSVIAHRVQFLGGRVSASVSPGHEIESEYESSTDSELTAMSA